MRDVRTRPDVLSVSVSPPSQQAETLKKKVTVATRIPPGVSHAKRSLLWVGLGGSLKS